MGACLYWRAVSYFRQDTFLLILLVLLVGVSVPLGLLMAWPMAILIDSTFSDAPAKHDLIHRLFLAVLPEGRLGQVIGLAAITILLKAIQDVLSIARTLVNNQINYNGLMRIQCQLHEKLQALDLAYHKSQPQGDAIYRLTRDTFSLQNILNALISAAIAAATLLAMTGILMWQSAPLALVALAIAPGLALCNLWFGRRIKDRAIECRQTDARFTAAVQQSIASVPLVQAFGREAAESLRFRGAVEDCIRTWWRLHRQEVAYWLVTGLLVGAGSAAVLGYGGYLVYRDQFLHRRPEGMSVGDLVVFTSYLGILWGPLCSLTAFGPSLQDALAGAARVFEVIDRQPAIADAPQAISLPAQPRRLTLENVCFQYPEGPPVLREISLQIQPGQMVAFVGASGVGKTTLLSLLARFYDPTGGSVRLDGQDVRQVRVWDVRRHVALVLQDTWLLPTTIGQNIAYGRPEASAQQVGHAAALAGAARFINSLPEKYDTPVCEGGQNLSGGQRQRIAIARALLTEAPILVLDEPTSGLDAQHERDLAASLCSLRGRRTVVLVSHRLSTVLDCDRIFVISQGRIVEQGTHGELIAQGGLYREMAHQQFLLDGPAGTSHAA